MFRALHKRTQNTRKKCLETIFVTLIIRSTTYRYHTIIITYIIITANMFFFCLKSFSMKFLNCFFLGFLIFFYIIISFVTCFDSLCNNFIIFNDAAVAIKTNYRNLMRQRNHTKSNASLHELL